MNIKDIVIKEGLEYLHLYTTEFINQITSETELAYYAPLYVMVMMAVIDLEVASEEKMLIEDVYAQLYPNKSFEVLKKIYVKQIEDPYSFEEIITQFKTKQMMLILYKIAYAVAMIDNKFRAEEIELLNSFKRLLPFPREELKAIEEELFSLLQN